MIRQNVNLYVDELKPKRTICNASQALIVSFLFIIIMLVQLFLNHSNHQVINAEYRQLSQDANALDLDDERNFSDRVQSEIESKKQLMQGQIAIIETNIKSKELLVTLVDREFKNNISSIYTAFYVIADKSGENIAISEIFMDKNEKELIINGLSRSKEAVPDYLSQVKNDVSFMDTVYGFLKIEQLEFESFYRFAMSRKNGEPIGYMSNSLDVNKSGG